MAEKYDKLLGVFESRVRQLMYLHDELKRENAELRQTLSEKERALAESRSNFKEMEACYANLKIAKTISIHDNEMKDTKQRLSKLVREVDKCIALLNE